MIQILKALITVFLMQKAAVLLCIALLLVAMWCKGKTFRKNPDLWDQYFQNMSSRKYVTLFFTFYTLAMALMSAAAYFICRGLHLPDPHLLAALTFLFGILKAAKEMDDHKKELWDKIRRFA